MMTERKDDRSGFTLVEMLVSAFVLGLIGLMGAGLLNSALSGREAAQDVLDRLEMLDRARTLLRDDMGQIIARPSRNADGIAARLSFAGDVDGVDPWQGVIDPGDRVILAFTRRGRLNPGNLSPRSTLHYVEYRLEGDQLIRRVWDYPDRAAETASRDRVLISGVSDLELDFLYGMSWRGDAAALAGPDGASGLPRGVRLRYALDRVGPVEHILLTPAAEGR